MKVPPPKNRRMLGAEALLEAALRKEKLSGGDLMAGILQALVGIGEMLHEMRPLEDN